MNSPSTYLPRQLRDLAPLEEPETTKQIGREAADLIDALAAETRNLRAELDRTKGGARCALKDLSRAYVNLLEVGRDRIISLGGECDSVEKMESGDPALISAKAVLSTLT